MPDKKTKTVIADDLESLCEQAAEFVAVYIADRAEVEDRVSVVLSGGTTPKGVYERLAGGKFKRSVPWNRVHLFWGDERCVPPESPDSNYSLAYQSFISRVPIPPENVHRMPGEDPDPEKAAAEYEQTLRNFFQSGRQEWPVFDLVLLGVGPEGHTASLFPGSPVLQEKKRWVVAPFVEKLKSYRITLTIPVFNHSRQVIFLAAGEEKAQVIKELQAQNDTRIRPPFQMIRPQNGRLIFFLDKAAAVNLVDDKKDRDEIFQDDCYRQRPCRIPGEK